MAHMTLPADVILVAESTQVLSHHGPVIEITLYRRPDRTYLVAWHYGTLQDNRWVGTLEHWAPCATFRDVLRSLADFDTQAWDPHPAATEQYVDAILELLDDYQVNRAIC